MTTASNSKSDLVKAVAEKTGYTQHGTAEIIDAFLAEITARTSAGSVVMLHKFGKFEARARPARSGRNPRTGEQVEIAASTRLTFKASKSAA